MAEVQGLPVRPRASAQAIESEVLAMLIFVISEVMFFGGFVSAFSILRARAAEGYWPPPEAPLLPAVSTAVVTVALLLSGAAVFLAGRAPTRDAAQRYLQAAGVLAAVFVVYQVYEFAVLVREGLDMVTTAFGGFFFTIVGAHALHCVVAILVLGWAAGRSRAGRLSPAMFRAVRIFWYFVVGLWPFLYARVYL